MKIASILFKPLKEGNYHIVVDGLKVAKEGKKMPAVKKLHQESNNNSKPEYIFGHSFQILAILVEDWCGSVFAVPLVSRIHEGVVFSNKDKRTLMAKMINILFAVTDVLNEKVILVADNYYANRKVIAPLIKKGMHLVSRLRSNAVAYHPPVSSKKQSGPARKKKYGRKVSLMSFFKKKNLFKSAKSPVYSEKKIIISFYSIELLWRPIGKKLQFIFVNHPKRGKIILMTTKLDIDPIRVIAIYGYRFKIEVSFKHAIHTIRSYAFHFWMQTMTPIKRVSGNQHLHKKSDKYRQQVRRKLKAYHLYVQMACIAQGLLLHLSIKHGASVWDSFRSWLRTMNKDRNPSEMVGLFRITDKPSRIYAR